MRIYYLTKPCLEHMITAAEVMAFSKSRNRSGEEGKSLGEMSSEPTTSLGGIVETSLSDESQNEVIEGSHHLACVANSQAGGIFLEGEITAIV